MLVSLSVSAYASNKYRVDFGLLELIDGAYKLKESTYKIPYRTKQQGQIFGLIIEPSGNEIFEYSSEIYMPSTPKFYNGEVQKEDEGSSAYYKLPARKADTAIAEIMWLDEGDPVGIYNIKTYINGALFNKFSFEVQPQAAQ